MWLSWAILLDYSILLVMRKIRQSYREKLASFIGPPYIVSSGVKS